jgi:hypothetical protein
MKHFTLTDISNQQDFTSPVLLKKKADIENKLTINSRSENKKVELINPVKKQSEQSLEGCIQRKPFG